MSSTFNDHLPRKSGRSICRAMWTVVRTRSLTPRTVDRPSPRIDTSAVRWLTSTGPHFRPNLRHSPHSTPTSNQRRPRPKAKRRHWRPQNASRSGQRVLIAVWLIRLPVQGLGQQRR